VNDRDCGTQAIQNPKNEILNPKQIQMLQAQMTKTEARRIDRFFLVAVVRARRRGIDSAPCAGGVAGSKTSFG